MDKNEANEEIKKKKEPEGESYNYSDQELIRLLVKSRKAQKHELEFEDLDDYFLPPRTQFSMLKRPMVTIRRDKITFNMASVRLFEEIEQILPLLSDKKQRLTAVMCAEEESGSVQWSRRRQKDDVLTNRDITSEEYAFSIYRMMGWDLTCRYKAPGHIANSSAGLCIVFDLKDAIEFQPEPVEIVDEETGEIKKKVVKKYPMSQQGKIGQSYNDYVESRQMNIFEYLDDYTNQGYSTDTNKTLSQRSEADMPQYYSPGEAGNAAVDPAEYYDSHTDESEVDINDQADSNNGERNNSAAISVNDSEGTDDTGGNGSRGNETMEGEQEQGST